MNNFDKEAMRRDRTALVHALKQAGAVFKGEGKECKCPFHPDRHASAGIYLSEGIWKFKCHSCPDQFGGDVFDVIAKAQNRSVEEVMREIAKDAQPRPLKQKPKRAAEPDAPAEPEPPPRVFATIQELAASCCRAPDVVEATYVYSNPDTKAAEMVVIRIRQPDGKRFSQARPVEGGFCFGAPEKPWPIYNRSRCRSVNEIVVVEGEKAVHALAEIGIVATTSPGGAGKAAYADWSPLAGKKLTLWPDNDSPDDRGMVRGMQHMRDVAAMCEALDPAPQISLLDPAHFELPPKGDAVEYLEIFGGDTIESKRISVNAALGMAESLGASGEVQELIEDTIAGRRIAVPWPWRNLGRITKALMPGTVTTICGDPGSTKSFLAIDAARYWHIESKIKIAIYELEEDRAYHLTRLLAQLSETSGLVDAEWVRDHPDLARESYNRFRAVLDSFGRRMTTAPNVQVSLDDLAAWVEKQASSRSRIIVIDPITAASTNEKPWIADLKFLMAVKASAVQHGCSVILITHPRKGSGSKRGIGLDDMAGGSAYARFTQTVIWIGCHEQPKQVRVIDEGVTRTDTVNRVIKIKKARNGRGAGSEIGFNFDHDTLRFTEAGIIKKPVKKPAADSAPPDDDRWSDAAPPQDPNLPFVN